MHVIACFVLAICAMLTSAQDLPTERDANTVEIKMYPLSESEWTGKSGGFASDIATAASVYCSGQPSQCGGVTSFSTSDVGISSVEDASKSMLVNFYVAIPGVSSSPFVLTSDAVEAITKAARPNIHSSINVWITYIEKTYLGIPRDVETDNIIIPLAVIVVVAVALVTIGLVKWEEKKEQDAKMLRRAEIRKSRRATKQHDDVIPISTPKVNGNKVQPKEFSTHKQRDVPMTTNLPHVVLDEQKPNEQIAVYTNNNRQHNAPPTVSDIVSSNSTGHASPTISATPYGYAPPTISATPTGYAPPTVSATPTGYETPTVSAMHSGYNPPTISATVNESANVAQSSLPPSYSDSQEPLPRQDTETEAERMERKRKKKEARRAERERKRLEEEMAARRGGEGGVESIA